MNDIDELIKKLCPNGVKYIKLNELLDYIQPTKYIVESSKYKDEYDIPVLTAGQTFILGYTNEKKGVYNANEENPVIIFDDFTASNHWVDFKFKVKSSAMKILINKTKNSFKYIFYCMQNIKYIPKEHARQWIQTYSQFKIPIPPLPVQREIVKILDKFSALEAELEAELEERQQQYKYYEDKIFKFKDKTMKVKLSDVLISLKTGLNPRKFFQLNTEDAKGYYVTVRELGDRQVKYWESKDKINQDALNRINERANLEINDVLFSGTGTIGRVSLIEKEPKEWNVKEGIYILKPNVKIINPVFLMYLMNSNYMKRIYSEHIVGSPVASVPMKDLKKVKFDLPSMDEQERIVKILDKFDDLCNNMLKGLPAEIELRRKQYEYYRNKLLSFKELK